MIELAVLTNEQCGRFFPDELLAEIRDRIYMVDYDTSGKRIYFENAGGAPTLKTICEAANTINQIPDFHNRPTPGARPLMALVKNGIEDAKLIFGAKSGSILADLTVSKSIFTMTGVIMKNVPGTNVVTTTLEHPSTHDASLFFAQMLNKEFREAKIDRNTGCVDVGDLLSKIDQNTILLSIIHASNILGTVNDIKYIIQEARKIKPDLYILLDSTQHIPHGTVDVEDLQVDACAFAPYKILGKRGLGIGWLGERVCRMPHPHFLQGAADDWDLGGYEPAGMAALSMIVDYVAWIGGHYSDSTDRRALFVAGMDAINMHERAIMYRMLHGSAETPGVEDLPGVHLYFMDDLTKRDAILPFSIDGIEAADLAPKFIDNGIYVFNRSRSNKMSRRVLDGADIPNIIRVAPMHFHSRQDVDAFLSLTAKIAAGEL